MKLSLKYILGAALAVTAGASQAAVVGVIGGLSSAGVAPAIIAAPPHALDDAVTNRGQEAFNERQGVLLAAPLAVDGGFIAAGTRVDSHMIFLNSVGTTALSHFGVDWVFSGPILGVMSDGGGTLEAASTPLLGAPATNYTVPFGGSGPAAPFPARGLEGNDGTGLGPFPKDGYALIAPNVLRVGMAVTEPGDWIRVVTLNPIPVPAAAPLLGGALLALGLFRRRKRN